MSIKDKIIKNPIPERYITVFLDILGSSDLLKKMDQAIASSQSDREVKKHVAKALYPVQRLRILVDSAYGAIRETKGEKFDLSNLSDEEVVAFNEAKNADAHYQSSGDSLYIFVKVSPEHTIGYLAALLDMLHVISYTSVCMLAFGHAIRGAISIGWGAKIFDDEILGAGIVDTYKMERNRALYPRIILENTIVDILATAINSIETDSPNRLQKHIAKDCDGMIYRDRDTEYTLDFLSKIALRNVPTSDREKIVGNAFDYIHFSLQNSLDSCDLKLMMKYSWLLQYFQMRVGLFKDALVSDQSNSKT